MRPSEVPHDIPHFASLTSFLYLLLLLCPLFSDILLPRDTLEMSAGRRTSAPNKTRFWRLGHPLGALARLPILDPTTQLYFVACFRNNLGHLFLEG